MRARAPSSLARGEFQIDPLPAAAVTPDAGRLRLGHGDGARTAQRIAFAGKRNPVSQMLCTATASRRSDAPMRSQRMDEAPPRSLARMTRTSAAATRADSSKPPSDKTGQIVIFRVVEVVRARFRCEKNHRRKHLPKTAFPELLVKGGGAPA